MAKEFEGIINVDIRDSQPDWSAFTADKAPEGAPNVLVVLFDDTGTAAWSPYGGRVSMPTLDRLAADGLTYSQWHTTALCSPTRSCFLTGRPRRMAARPGLRPLLRLHRRRDQQLVSGPGRGQPLHRPALPARGRLPPLQGPRRQGAELHPRLQAVRAGQALVPVVLPGREPRPAPRPAGVHRQVQGHVRRRLRGLPRMGAAADDRARHPARGHRADPDQPDAARARSRQADAVRPWDELNDDEKRLFSPHGRGVRRLLRVHRRPGRPDRRLPRGVRPARQHDHLLLRRQRRVRRGQPERVGQRGQVLQRLPRRPSRRTWRMVDKLGQPGHLQPLPDRLGGGVLDAVTGCSSATRTRAASATRWSSHWPKGIKARGEVRDQYHHCDRHRPDHPRRAAASRCRRSSTASSRRRCRACRCATRSTTPTRRHARRRSTTRCSATAASGTRAGRPSPSTAR